jgi:hypothetical protein
MALSFSKLSIINQALLAIGASPVANENETERSKFISEKLDQLLPLLLLTETWRFAIKYREENTLSPRIFHLITDIPINYLLIMEGCST